MGYLLPCIFKWLLNYAIVPKNLMLYIYIHVFVLYAVKIFESRKQRIISWSRPLSRPHPNVITLI